MEEEVLYMLDSEYRTTEEFLESFFDFIQNDEIKNEIIKRELENFTKIAPLENATQVKPSEFFKNVYENLWKKIDLMGTYNFFERNTVKDVAFTILYEDPPIVEGIAFTNSVEKVLESFIMRNIVINKKEIIRFIISELNKQLDVEVSKYKIKVGFGGIHWKSEEEKIKLEIVEDRREVKAVNGSISIPLFFKEDIFYFLNFIYDSPVLKLGKYLFLRNLTRKKVGEAIKKQALEIAYTQIEERYGFLPYTEDSCNIIELDLTFAEPKEIECVKLNMKKNK